MSRVESDDSLKVGVGSIVRVEGAVLRVANTACRKERVQLKYISFSVRKERGRPLASWVLQLWPHPSAL